MFRRTNTFCWLALCSISLLLAACGSAATAPTSTTASAVSTSSATTTAGTAALKAVATTSIIADLVQNVGGDRVTVQAMLPPGTDPHTYSPAPSDVQAVAEADIVFENGLGLEEWLAELTQNAGGERPTIVVSEGITPIEGGEHAEEHGDEHADQATASGADEHDEHAEAGDPHMWFDVRNTIRYVENIRDGLKQSDPAGASVYDANAAAYIQQLEQLDAEIEQQTSAIPQERRKLITNHDTFGYFAQRYGFEIAGSVFENVSTEQEPSAQQITELVRLIQEQNVPAIFTENTVNSRLAEQVADEAGIRVVTSLYTDALGEAGSPGDSYINMMRFNTQQITEALQ